MDHIFVATPMYGGMCAGYYCQSLLRLNQYARGRFDVTCSFMFNESLITRARNAMVHAFMKSSCTHLMFIDADIQFEPETVHQMLEQNLDIIAGVYPKKEINWELLEAAVKAGVPAQQLKSYTGAHVVNLLEGQEASVRADRPLEVMHAGTGFMLIQRHVFESLKPDLPTYRNDVKDLEGNLQRGDDIVEYFTTSIDEKSGSLLSEDYHFCKAWRSIGGQVHIAPWVQLTHIGTFAFEGRLPPAP